MDIDANIKTSKVEADVAYAKKLQYKKEYCIKTLGQPFFKSLQDRFEQIIRDTSVNSVMRLNDNTYQVVCGVELNLEDMNFEMLSDNDYDVFDILTSVCPIDSIKGIVMKGININFESHLGYNYCFKLNFKKKPSDSMLLCCFPVSLPFAIHHTIMFNKIRKAPPKRIVTTVSYVFQYKDLQ